MHPPSAPSTRPTLAVLLLLLVMPLAQASEDAVIRFHVSLPEHQAHRVNVRMTLEGLPDGDSIELSMPVWTPGSYLVREYARNLIELSAATADGSPLAVDKPDKSTWRIHVGGAPSIAVDYQLYANEVSVRTSHVTADHAYLQPAASFLRYGPAADAPQRVSIATPAGWGVFTSLHADDAGDLLAADYDELVDSPIELGPHEVLQFEVRGVPHRMVLAGQTDVERDRLADDAAAICTEVASIFDRMPFDDYTFIIPLVDSGGGGLEHKNSSVCMTNRWGLSDENRYRRLLSLIAHEYFHAWNVKRFRPRALGPFDYSRENYTPDLWVAEGFTSYYDDLSVLRAGYAKSTADYLESLAEAFKGEADRPGSKHMSLARASRDAWIKYYRPDENSSNVSISYYTKGSLVALMLDLRVRRLTGGAKTLADVLRLGWERFTARGVGYPPGAIKDLASELTGRDLSAEFAAWVEGTGPLDPDPDLAWVGLELKREPQKTKRPLPEDDQGFALEPFLGISTRSANGLVRVDVVREDGPAFAAGLNHDDVLLAIDHMRVDPGTFQDRLDRHHDGPLRLTFWRGQELRTLDIEPERRRLEDWSIAPVEQPSEAQRQAFETWTGQDFPSADEEDDPAGGD